MVAPSCEQHRDLREQLGAAKDAEGIFGVALTACEREEAAAAAPSAAPSAAEAAAGEEAEAAAARPALMRARCDDEAAPFVSWYRRHRHAGAAPRPPTSADE